MMKKIRLYNTLARSKEEIVPEKDNLIRIYSCGLTVYDYAHIGNLRKYIFDDLLVRVLKYFGYKVKNVMNITDVGHLISDEDEGEDKIEKGARREGMDAFSVAKHFEAAFLEDLQKLNIEKPEILCRATEHIDDQIKLIKLLEERGYTYKTADGIYFDTSKSKEYGKLARLNVGGQKEGARVVKNPEKKNPADFALWKLSHPTGGHPELDSGSKKRDMEWPSPWGVGFPGWHIECSAMSTKYLGQPFEVHTGGIDHIPVHHTNEIAQSEAACDLPLAKYWIHSEHLLVNGKKMSKSEGSFLRLKDLEDKGFDPLDFRFLCLSAHYQSKLDFSFESLSQAKNSLLKIRNFSKNLKDTNGDPKESDFYNNTLLKFEGALSDNLDTPRALAIVFMTLAEAEKQNYKNAQALNFLKKIDEIFALELFKTFKIPQDITGLVKQREELRKKGLFEEADKVRFEIEKKGFELEDLKNETRITQK